MRITQIDVSYLDPGVVIEDDLKLAAAPEGQALDGIEDIDGDWITVASTSFPDQEPVTYLNQTFAGYNLGVLNVFPVSYDAAAGTVTRYSTRPLPSPYALPLSSKRSSCFFQYAAARSPGFQRKMQRRSVISRRGDG